MITKEYIEKRLKLLEKEQENQNYALDQLKYFNDEVQRLEKELLEIEKYRLKNPQASQFERNNPETERLERELAQIDNEEQNALKNSQQASPTISKQGYIICLMFNPQSPPEWSGEGWLKPGQGTAYNLEEAKLLLQEMKKKWPNYPLKIIQK
jgi:uncharacterized protein (UPF0335 family)